MRNENSDMGHIKCPRGPQVPPLLYYLKESTFEHMSADVFQCVRFSEAFKNKSFVKRAMPFKSQDVFFEKYT